MTELEPAIRTDHLTKRYRGVTAVQDMSFTVAPGEILGMLGPNGAGKTTTLRMIVGLAAPSEGDVHILGHSVVREREAALAQVGTIIEEARFYPYLSGVENLRQVSRLRGLPLDDRRVLEALTNVGLAEAAKRTVRTYSLGMRQRLALALALLHSPGVLILDEPMNGLDPAAIKDLRDRIKAMAASGVTVILSSHLLAEVEQLCDRVILIEKGRLIGQQVLSETSKAGVDVRVALRDGAEQGEMSLLTAGYRVRRSGSDLIIPDQNPDRVPEIVRLLVAQNLNLYAVEARQPTLEDRYLAMTSQTAASGADQDRGAGA